MPPPTCPLTSPRRRSSTAVACALLAIGCDPEQSAQVIALPEAPSAQTPLVRQSDVNEDLSPRVLRRFAALEMSPTPASPLVDLGRMLYYEPRLSLSGLVSCNSCHPLDQYGATNTAVSTGIFGRQGTRNAPSTFHASGHFVQFWDGRIPTIEMQAVEPIKNPAEMGMQGPEVVAVLQKLEGYRTAFALAFPAEAEPVTFEHVGQAIGAFERGLVTPSRWDRYLSGDRSALTSREKEGAKLFANLGCIVCHTGPYVGGSMFERVGSRIPWPSQKDQGRSGVTANEADQMVFKVPSLRNVAQTAPYFHDGSAATLDVAIRMMGRHQLGLDLVDDEVRDLSAWMGSLTGEIPSAYVAKPALPAGG